MTVRHFVLGLRVLSAAELAGLTTEELGMTAPVTCEWLADHFYDCGCRDL